MPWFKKIKITMHQQLWVKSNEPSLEKQAKNLTPRTYAKPSFSPTPSSTVSSSPRRTCSAKI
jgi:hypothetical protein